MTGSEYGRTELAVDGMVCANCEQLVAAAVVDVPGVSRASADADSGTVVVHADPDAVPVVREAIAATGFGVES
ncbi:heavy-metal-associated domain-containing protein [Haloarcula sp. S1CR25-12]|uniref:Heavy-metal-associated domain-containing protein n=1 Tax=Haloarcula saliterrae TaxID=2950534 RepID=A0ABU2FEA0_9EURY|nr:heavy metal-associated domain-containing protein [Haloarcula sp. S1CR25-12]MDS0260584.1 heavy-metal-associated domain-containing protein [Haloarcula sp. S1CR25-12]